MRLNLIAQPIRQRHGEQGHEHPGSPPWGPSRARTGPWRELQEATGRCLRAPLPSDWLPATLAGPLLWALPTPDTGYEHFSLLFCMDKRQASCQLSPLKRQPRRKAFSSGITQCHPGWAGIVGGPRSQLGSGRQGPHKASRWRLHALGCSGPVY